MRSKSEHDIHLYVSPASHTLGLNESNSMECFQYALILTDLSHRTRYGAFNLLVMAMLNKSYGWGLSGVLDARLVPRLQKLF